MTLETSLTTSVSGPSLFARYAYPPNELGYCGPRDSGALIESGTDPGGAALLGHLAHQFDGAWPYLELIAQCNGISDPLDRRVVEAYWVGNALSLRVPAMSLATSLDERFARRSARNFEPLVSAAFTGGVIQHSFHVFAVYPWFGMLRAGKEGAPLDVLERCRIRWGHVVDVEGDFVTVTSRPLIFEGSQLCFGDERLEVVRRAFDGVGFVEDLAPGDPVSMHWDWVCDRLSEVSLRWLQRCTRKNLHAVNCLDRPGPAFVCGA
ncbi:MAG: DUF6390 family protein [Acidimicrobiales bacterium]|jgi:hypothetical protein